MIERKEIDWVRSLLNEPTESFWTDKEVETAIEQTRIFNHLMAVEVLRLKDGEEIKVPHLDELKKLLEAAFGVEND